MDRTRYATYGREVPRSHVRPGDVLYFQQARFLTVKKTRNSASRRVSILGHPQHVAIVRSVLGPQIEILHQGNVNQPKQGVTTLTINFTELQSGLVKAYRAAPPSSSVKPQPDSSKEQ